MLRHSRRAALLGGAGLLAGCTSFNETLDNIFGEKKVPLKGDRLSVLAAERPLNVDPGAQRPVTLPAPAANAAWPQAGGTPDHSPGNPALGAGLREAWRASAGTGTGYRRRIIAPPIVADGLVVACDAYGEVTAFDTGSHRRRWSFDSRRPKEGESSLGAGAAFEGGTLYVATAFAELIALDPADGKPRWRADLPAPARGAPTIAAGRAFLVTTENHLIALSTEDGRRLWTYRGQPTVTMALGLPAPAVEGDIVVAGFASGEVAAVRASDGRALWSETLASIRGGGLADIAAVTALPVIDQGRVFATGLGGITIALDLRTGRRLWERDVAAAETPVVAGGWLFLLSTGADLVCLGRDDGRVRWLTPLRRYRNEEKKRDPINWGAPVLAGGRLILPGSHGRLAEIDPAEGTEIGLVRISGGATLQPAVAGGTLYLLADDGTLIALSGTG